MRNFRIQDRVALNLSCAVGPDLESKLRIRPPSKTNFSSLLVPRTRSSHIFSAGTVANFGFKSGTRFIELLVSSSIPKFAQRARRMLANFGIGTLAAWEPTHRGPNWWLKVPAGNLPRRIFRGNEHVEPWEGCGRAAVRRWHRADRDTCVGDAAESRAQERSARRGRERAMG